MSNTENIEQLFNESNKLFIALRLELEHVFEHLKIFEENSSLGIKKNGIYKHVKKLIPCFDIFFKVAETSSIQSLITLQRMIVDNYAILYLLTNHSTKEEQLLRYYLYLLDATSSRSDILMSFLSSINHELAENAENTEYAISNDKKATAELLERIKEIQLKLHINEEIIANANWKFKDIKANNHNKNKFKWTELYALSRIPSHHADMLQKFHSTFVHGLGIPLMFESDESILPLKISAMDYCSIFLSLIIKIIMIEYENETKEVVLNKNTIDFMNANWVNWGKKHER